MKTVKDPPSCEFLKMNHADETGASATYKKEMERTNNGQWKRVIGAMSADEARHAKNLDKMAKKAGCKL